MVTNFLREKTNGLGKRALNWQEIIRSSVKDRKKQKKKNKKQQVHKKISKKDASIEERTEGTKLGSNRQVI